MFSRRARKHALSSNVCRYNMCVDVFSCFQAEVYLKELRFVRVLSKQGVSQFACSKTPHHSTESFCPPYSYHAIFRLDMPVVSVRA